MKIIFVGRNNAFNWGIIRWLHEHYSLQAAFFVEMDRFRWKSRLEILWRRTKRRGLLRVLDELAFRVMYSIRYSRRDSRLIRGRLPQDYWAPKPLEIPTYDCGDIHADSCIERIRQLAPDLIYGVCTRTIFKPCLYEIPRFGMFMLHEGIAPEYRGLHTAAWAILKHEYNYLGYTLLKIDSGIDTGPILCQGVYPYQEDSGLCFGFVGHAALVHGLPEMKEKLDRLYRQHGKFESVPTSERSSHLYSWIGVSDFLRLRRSDNQTKEPANSR